MYSTIELTDLKLNTDIGTYGAGDVVPSAHLLDLTLSIDPALVLIETDGMAHIFDYDPLIDEIDRLARDGYHETQERLITRHCCRVCGSASGKFCRDLPAQNASDR